MLKRQTKTHKCFNDELSSKSRTNHVLDDSESHLKQQTKLQKPYYPRLGRLGESGGGGV